MISYGSSIGCAVLSAFDPGCRFRRRGEALTDGFTTARLENSLSVTLATRRKRRTAAPLSW